MVDPVYAGKGVPRGDGGPVMLIPGFLAGDSSMTVMAGWLERMGHAPHRSGSPGTSAARTARSTRSRRGRSGSRASPGASSP